MYFFRIFKNTRKTQTPYFVNCTVCMDMFTPLRGSRLAWITFAKLSRAHTSDMDGKGEDGKVENVSSNKENTEENICEVVSQLEVLIDDYSSL